MDTKTKKVLNIHDDYKFIYHIYAYRELTKKECREIIAEHNKKYMPRISKKRPLIIDTEIQ